MPARSTREPGGTALVAAVGHAWLRDQSFGLKVVEQLHERGVPHGVELADLSCGTIPAFQRLAARRYRRVVFVSGTARGRPPGTLHVAAAPRAWPEPEVQGRIADGVMGLVHVDNLLAAGTYYGALPDDVVLVEAEPADESWGGDLSPELAALLEPAAALVLAELARPAPGAGGDAGH